MNSKIKSNQDWTITIISLGIILLLVVLLTLFPEEGQAQISAVFNFVVNSIGAPLLWAGIFAIVFVLYISFSKHGKIRLGKGDPEYSLFSYVGMMFCGGLGSSAVYWSLTEWTYYYTGPAFGIEPGSVAAAEMATAYNLFHWGLIPWGIIAAMSLPVAYAFHVRKVEALRLSVVCEAMMGNFRYKKAVGKIIDVCVVFGIVSCCIILLGLGLPMLSNGLSKVTGLEMTFGSNVIIILAITIVFTISSYVGTKKGMQRISKATIIAAFIFSGFLLLYGPTDFILRQITTGFGLMIEEFVSMATYGDAVARTGFPEAWTIFFIGYGYAFAILMFLFITKISKGRTLKEVGLGAMVGGASGSWLFFGINGSYSMSAQLSGEVDVIGIMAEEGGPEAIMQLLLNLPVGEVIIAFFIIMAGLFLATSLDSAAFSLSASTTKALKPDENTSPFIRVFWCLVCAALPLVMIYIEAPLAILQSIVTILALPLIAITVFMVIRLRSWLKEDSIKKV